MYETFLSKTSSSRDNPMSRLFCYILCILPICSFQVNLIRTSFISLTLFCFHSTVYKSFIIQHCLLIEVKFCSSAPHTLARNEVIKIKYSSSDLTRAYSFVIRLRYIFSMSLMCDLIHSMKAAQFARKIHRME